MINLSVSSSTKLAFFAIYILFTNSTYALVDFGGKNWATSCDFKGNNLSNVQIPSEQCGGRCNETPECTHFTWTQFNGGTCWMKTGSVTANDAFPSNDHTMICGIKNISPIPSGQVGNTTRYWDCCKPSCGWPDKVSGTNPVKSCSKDGNSALGDYTVKSGCEGGDAFVCNSQQPWVVNDRLAYGFAAATIPGINNACCACYKLDFTNGSVQGKSMIVQVTNSGTDVHPNQFDLQIPGGGVGQFNGCSKQWNTGTDGWGDQYGGVHSADGCNNLPEPLKNGCLFRFNWLGGADNPTMVYSKVQCPQELVDKTGCKNDG